MVGNRRFISGLEFNLSLVLCPIAVVVFELHKYQEGYCSQQYDKLYGEFNAFHIKWFVCFLILMEN